MIVFNIVNMLCLGFFLNFVLVFIVIIKERFLLDNHIEN